MAATPKKKNANFTKAMKLVESGASGFKIIGYTRKLAPEDEVAVFEALAKRAEPPGEAPDLLAQAYARAGRFAEAVRAAKKGKYSHTLHEVGEAALDAGAFGDAEAAFAAVKKPRAVSLVGLAVAQKKAGKDPKAVLARAEKANVAKKPIDWKSATSCYEHVGIAITNAMIAAVRGDMAKAKQTLAKARVEFQQVEQKGVRQECFDELGTPDALAKHAGL